MDKGWFAMSVCVHSRNFVWVNVSKLFNRQEKETDKTSNCVGEVGRWGEVLR